MRIIRRTITVDADGRPLAERVEQLFEDGDGNVEEAQAEAVYVCEACGRPVEKVQDIRGACVRCGRQCCVTCEGFCAVCRRPLCGRCREGFAAQGLSVCDGCLGRLRERLAWEDRLQEDKAAFERLMAAYGAQMRLLQSSGQAPDSLAGTLSRIMQVRLQRRLSRMAQRLAREHEDGPRLLP
jgi:hypothetical protein